MTIILDANTKVLWRILAEEMERINIKETEHCKSFVEIIESGPQTNLMILVEEIQSLTNLLLEFPEWI
jgi:hypothetical protein